MNNSADEPSREQELYWLEFTQLKTDACYIRDYRDALGKWVTGIGTLRAVASTGSIAGWLLWRKLALLWAALIAAAQLADALKDVFPFYKRRAALSRWSRALNKLFVESQGDWDDIAAGRCSDIQIAKLLKRLRARKDQAEAKYIPNGLAKRSDLFNQAQNESKDFFAQRYNLSESKEPS